MNEPRSSAEEGRFSAHVPSPLGPLLIVIRGNAVVGLYHEDHDPPPKPVLLGRTFDPVRSADCGRVLRPSRDQDGSSSRDQDGRDGQEGQNGQDEQNDRTISAPGHTGDLFRRTALQLEGYFAGTRKTFDCPTVPAGTPFQLRVWSALADIPYGERRTYRDIAAELGNPSMGRAIGAAVRANPLSIIVPGHRVVARNGGVIGYAAGAAAKEWLLRLEAGQTPG